MQVPVHRPGADLPSVWTGWEADVALARTECDAFSMRRCISTLVVLAIAASISIAAPAYADEQPPPCPVRWAERGRPLVSTAETAKAIFLAVEADIFPAADPDQYPEVVAEDEGEWWSVFRHRPSEPLPDGSVIVTAGGGQLSLRIAKCDARIIEVWLTR